MGIWGFWVSSWVLEFWVKILWLLAVGLGLLLLWHFDTRARGRGAELEVPLVACLLAVEWISV